jgi:hypothetical protein
MLSLLAGIFCQATYVYFKILLSKGELAWDAAHHSLWGMIIYSDILQRNWLSFIFDTYRQVYWPFIHSWLLSISMLFLGPSEVSVRLVSLAAYSLTAIFLGLILYRADSGNYFISIFITLGLWLTSVEFIKAFATEALIESSVILMTSISIFIMANAFKMRSRNSSIFAGLFSMLTYFTKTDYGLILILSYLTVIVISCTRDDHKFNNYDMIIAYLVPIIILAILWFADISKISATISALINRQQGPQWDSYAGIIYHFIQLIHWSDSTLIFVLLIWCFISSFFIKRPEIVNVILAYITISILLHMFSQTKDAKHIIKILPWLFVLAGFISIQIWQRINGIKYAAIYKISFILTMSLILLFRLQYFGKVSPPDNGPTEIATAICDRIDINISNIIVGEYIEVSPYLIDWKLINKNINRLYLPDVKKEEFLKKINLWRKRYAWISFMEKGGQGKIANIYHVYPVIEGDEKFQSEKRLNRSLIMRKFDRIFVLSVNPDSPYFTDDYQRYFIHGNDLIPLILNRSDYILHGIVNFEESKVKLFIFYHRETEYSRRKADRASFGEFGK